MHFSCSKFNLLVNPIHWHYLISICLPFHSIKVSSITFNPHFCGNLLIGQFAKRLPHNIRSHVRLCCSVIVTFSFAKSVYPYFILELRAHSSIAEWDVRIARAQSYACLRTFKLPHRCIAGVGIRPYDQNP